MRPVTAESAAAVSHAAAEAAAPPAAAEAAGIAAGPVASESDEQFERLCQALLAASKLIDTVCALRDPGHITAFRLQWILPLPAGFHCFSTDLSS